jgi:hypothetical protein
MHGLLESRTPGAWPAPDRADHPAMIERAVFTPDHDSLRDPFRKFIDKEVAVP